MSKKIDFNIDPSEIKDLFEKYSSRTLDSLGIILMWVRNYRMDATNRAFKEVYTGDTSGKWEDKFNEKEYIDKINNFDLSEVDNSIGELGETQLKFLSNIMEDALSHVESHDTIEVPIIPTILITMFNINNKLADMDKERNILFPNEMKNFFGKYDIMELKSFDVIFKYVYNIGCLCDIMHIRDEVLKVKINTTPGDISEYNLSNLTKKNNMLNDQELNFLLALLSDAAFFFSVTSDLATIYEVTEDLEYDPYHANTICKMLEETAADREERLLTSTQKVIGTIA